MSAWPDRPTPGLKPMPQGPRPNSCPPGVVARTFSAHPRPNPRPIPRSLKLILTIRINVIFCQVQMGLLVYILVYVIGRKF
ncbi:hypothetical protein HanRHA438_Chr09g0416461 [Helianthus annuus]|nr:hypothetical protein HanRHA438_Chr09g0416461 [Helianthus annuus]